MSVARERSATAAAAASGGLVARLREALSHTLVYGVGSVLQSVLQFVLIPLYTHYYTPDMYGVLTLVTLTATLAGAFFYFGGASAMSRSYYDYEDPADRRVVVGTALGITSVGAVLQIVLGAIAAGPLSVALFGTPDYAPHLRLALASSALTFVNAFFFMVLRFERRSAIVVVLNLVSLGATTGLIVWLLARVQLGVMAPILGALISQAVLTLALIWACRSYIALRISWHEVDLQLRYGFSAVAIGLTYYALDSIDRGFIARYGTLSDVGVYSLGYRIGMAIHILFIMPFAQIWAPMRMQYRDDPTYAELSKVVLTYYWIAGMFATVVVAVFAREVLAVASGRPEYIEAYRVVPYVMLAHLFYGALNIIDFGIALTRKVIYHVYIFSGAIAFNAALNVLLVPAWGYMAAAYVKLASYIVVAATVYVVSNRLYALPSDVRRIATVVVSGTVVLFAGVALTAGSPARTAAAKVVLIVALAVFWYARVLTGRERTRLRPAQWLRALHV